MYKAITIKLFDSFTKNTEIEKENFKTMLENNLFNNHKRQEWMNKEILKKIRHIENKEQITDANSTLSVNILNWIIIHPK